MVRKKSALLSSFDWKCSELGPPLIMKAGSAPAIHGIMNKLNNDLPH